MVKSKSGKKPSTRKGRTRATADAPLSDSASLHRIANTLGFLALRYSDFKEKSDTEQILFLAGLGFDRKGIAAIVGTTPNTVSVRLSEAKAQQAKKPVEKGV